MALVKQDTHLGFDIQKYAKISEFKVNEAGQDDDGKLYSSVIGVEYFTNPDKQFNIGGGSYNVQGLRLENLNLEGMYVGLKTLSDFEGREDLI